jgi:hypothetical protein
MKRVFSLRKGIGRIAGGSKGDEGKIKKIIKY